MLVIQPYRAPHDRNGNPRVMAIVVDGEQGLREIGGTDVGYRSPGQAVSEDYPSTRQWHALYVEPEVIVTVKEYREMRKTWEV